MEFLVAQPDKAAEVSWSFSVCEAEPVVRDSPTCAAPSFANASSDGASSALPGFTFRVPEEEELLGMDELLVLGAFCFDAEILVPGRAEDFLDYRCSGGGDPHLVSTTIGVERGDVANLNPDLGVVAWAFDTVPWSSAPLDSELYHGCADVPFELPRVDAGSGDHVISFTVPSGQREPIEQRSSRAASHETYQLSHVVSAGELERPFSVIDDESSDSELRLLWDAPKDVPDEGLVVRFYFVARDLRGGSDFAMGAVCVDPE